MKHFLALILTCISFSSLAFTNCSRQETNGIFSISIYETTPVKILVIDPKISVAPKSFICEKRTNREGEDTLSTYSCKGGYMGQKETTLAVFVNETQKSANYYEADESQDRENLNCTIN